MERILHVVPNMQSGGLETFIMNVYRNIDRNKLQFDFLVHYIEEKFYDNEIEKLGGRIYRFSLREDNNIFKYLKELHTFFNNHKEYRIIHCHMESIGFLFFLIAKLHGVKIRIAHSHNCGTEKNFKGFIKRILIQPYKYICNYRFACSEDAGKFLFGDKNFEVIENGIDIEKFVFNTNIRNDIRNKLNIGDKYVVGHVGRFSEQKNHEFLIEIFNEFSKEKEDVILMMIGDGELKDKIQRKVKQYNIENKVIFIDSITNINEMYQAMDCFAFPSTSEGLGIVLIEAQVSGLNVIASNNVPVDVEITDNIERIDNDLKKWIKALNEKYHSYERKKIDDRINKFCIQNVSKKLTSKYFGMIINEEQ